MRNINLPSTYKAMETENKWMEIWLKNKYFHATINSDKKSFSIALPPPNITGSLHMGHAVNASIQDALIRRKRMQGYNTLWMPGTDHAGIATQNVVEKMLKKEEGKSRHDIGREEFIKRVWEWKEKYGNTIYSQLKRLGCSLDYDRARFTMDKDYCRAIRYVFVDWFKRGLIYRGLRSVNWCTRCLTTLSDLEVNHEERTDKLYYIRYPFPDKKDDGIVVATVRPETMLGDVAVAVNPSDDRYKDLIGKKVILPLVNKEIPIIGDDYVEKDFGTGALKITPAHDSNDFEIGNKHNLTPVNVFTPEGIINELGGVYMGLDRDKCRERILNDLKEQNFLIKIEDYVHNIGKCYRCDTIIEPYLSEQWFVKMEELAKPAIEVVKEGKVKFIPDRWKEIYINWLENVKDWCISRQLWWGHQIPVWYCNDCNETIVDLNDVDTCTKCNSKNITQDPDVLDTWFSSALWTFVTLGWPDETEELKYFHPTSVLSTARDIINLWVARMVYSSMDFLKEVPFHHVLIHATIMDSEGKRMSKSKGTGVDPLEIIDKYGADASRFWLSSVGMSNQDVRYSHEKIESSRNFVTKIWNACRFVFMNLDDFDPDFIANQDDFTLPDRWILSRLIEVTERLNDSFERYDLSDVARCLYDYIWDEFCDWYLEIVKPRLKNGDKKVVQYILTYIIDKILRLLHPLMPFVTEELWENLKLSGFKTSESHLVVAKWVEEIEIYHKDKNSTDQMVLLMDIIRCIRNLRAEFGIQVNKYVEKVNLYTINSNIKEILKEGKSYIEFLSKVNNVIISDTPLQEKYTANSVVSEIQISLPLFGLIDIDKEKQRLNKEISKIHTEIEKIKVKLQNKNFLDKAPLEIVNKEKDKLSELEEKKSILKQKLEKLNN